MVTLEIVLPNSADPQAALQTLAENCRSAGVVPRPGLLAIGMRSDPYGRSVVANPAQIRVPMAMADSRHAGLSGAAWATAGLAAIAGQGVESLYLGLANEPLGLCANGRFAPLYHVARAARDMAGQTAHRVKQDGLV